MKLQLRPHETVIHPQPFVEDEPAPLIVTTQRVIWSGGGKKQEIEGQNIKAKAKGLNQRVVAAMAVLVLLGAPFFIIGAIKYISYRDAPTEAPPVVKGQPAPQITMGKKAEWESNKTNKILGIGLGVFGALAIGGAYLLYKRRLTVIVAGGGKIFQIPVKDDKEQDKILTMVGAAQTASQAMASAVAATAKAPQAPPKR